MLIVKKTVIQLFRDIESITNMNHRLRITSITIISIGIVCQMFLLNKYNHSQHKC